MDFLEIYYLIKRNCEIMACALTFSSTKCYQVLAMRGRPSALAHIFPDFLEYTDAQAIIFRFLYINWLISKKPVRCNR
jgi:hypothetical protein